MLIKFHMARITITKHVDINYECDIHDKETTERQIKADLKKIHGVNSTIDIWHKSASPPINDT